ncbi:MAG: HNH endonuclease [Muribaculaceae bacterium]|nr:HNH endonuclease [Muribaculaceae bacterium]
MENEAKYEVTAMCEFPEKATKIRGSYFPGESYDFERTPDKLSLFVEMLKARGCYISEDGHIRSKKGGLMSKLARNGYWQTIAQYNKKCYYFCEHRVVWVWYNGAIPDGKEINHIDYNRSNNHIENLEVVSHSENMQHSRPNFNPPRGEKSGNAKISDKEAKVIKTLGMICGWSNKQISTLIGDKMASSSIGRIVSGQRYPHIEAGEIMEVYPTIVDFTRNKNVGLTEELKDYSLGLAGETGEVCDLIKKMLYHGQDVSPVEIALELGDVLYYLCAICNVLGIDFYEIYLNNNAKIMARYPNGFSHADSNNRIEDLSPL